MATFVIEGTVRRGDVYDLTEHAQILEALGFTDLRRDCECGKRLATLLVLSGRGRETWICGDCAVAGSEPQPPAITALNGETVVCDSVATVRSAVASGIKFSSVQAFELAERYETAKRRWDKQTRKHGFKRVVADPRKRQSKSLWSPYTS